MSDGPQPPITKTRVHRWINTKDFTDRYGVQVRAGRKWHHLAINHEAALFSTIEEAQAKADEIMRQVSK